MDGSKKQGNIQRKQLGIDWENIGNKSLGNCITNGHATLKVIHIWHKLLMKYIPSDGDNLIVQECNQILLMRSHRVWSDLGHQFDLIMLLLELGHSIQD